MFNATGVMDGFQRLTQALAGWGSEVLCFKLGDADPFQIVAAEGEGASCAAERLSVESVLGSVLMVEGVFDPDSLDREYLKLVEGWTDPVHGAAMVQMEGRGRCIVLLPS
ncbi:MAG: hypothetical protein H6827_09705 [Planctomycetes bacterium]|nr:hypothetical protein [Planctomycetota bacterium]